MNEYDKVTWHQGHPNPAFSVVPDGHVSNGVTLDVKFHEHAAATLHQH